MKSPSLKESLVTSMSFEVQTYRNGNWDITKVLEDKNSAIAEAQKMLEGKIHFSVEVVEEIHDEATDQYRSKVVFRKEKKVKSKEEEKKAKPAGAAERQSQEEEAAEEGDEDEDEEGAAAAVPKKKIGFEKIFIRGLFTVLLLLGGAASYWQSQQPDPEPEIEGPPKTSLEAEMLKNLLSESDDEKLAEAREAAARKLSEEPGSTSFGEWNSVSGAAQKGFTEELKSSGAGLSGVSEGEGSGEDVGGEGGGGEEGGGEEVPGDITFGSGPAEEWSSVSGAAQKGFTEKRKATRGGQYGTSGGGGSGEGGGGESVGEEVPGDITFGSGPAGEWSSVAESVRKGFAGQRSASRSGVGAESGVSGESGVGGGSQEEELAALTPLGPPIFFPLPVFEYLDVRNKRLERAVVLQVTLDVLGDEGLERVEEKADDLHTALNKELSRIVSKAEKDKDSFTVSFLKKRFLVVCARELGKGVVREVLIQDSREARSSR